VKGEEAFFRPPYHHLRHPMIFYYGHPPVLYINKLRVAGLIEKPLNPYFEQLFETGVDEMRWDDMSKNEMLWPSIQEVHAYRQQVYRTVRGVIETHPDLASGHAPITPQHPLWALFMGFEHERIHLETSSVLIRELPLPSSSDPPPGQSCIPVPTEWQANFHPAHGYDYPANALITVPASRWPWASRPTGPLMAGTMNTVGGKPRSSRFRPAAIRSATASFISSLPKAAIGNSATGQPPVGNGVHSAT
jgi:hypothetical protein